MVSHGNQLGFRDKEVERNGVPLVPLLRRKKKKSLQDAGGNDSSQEKRKENCGERECIERFSMCDLLGSHMSTCVVFVVAIKKIYRIV